MGRKKTKHSKKFLAKIEQMFPKRKPRKKKTEEPSADKVSDVENKEE